MKINYSFTKSNENTCVALGFFDGIHLGHQAIIANTIKKANLTNTIPTVFTFSKRPKNIINNIYNNNLTTQKQKEELLNNMGIKLLYCIDFLKIMDLSPENFVKIILKDILNAKYVFCGFNYHFGKNAIAGYKELTDICKKYSIKVFVIEPFIIEKNAVSSSTIRNLIKQGNIKSANQLLGRPFYIESPVKKFNIVKENCSNTTIIEQFFYDDIIVPKFGTYKSYVIIDGIKYNSLSFVKKSFENLILCETHIFNYKNDLHAKSAKVFFTDYLKSYVTQ